MKRTQNHSTRCPETNIDGLNLGLEASGPDLSFEGCGLINIIAKMAQVCAKMTYDHYSIRGFV